jgi:VanZ family protein/glycopeptide antibiotics resistance protein
MKPGRNHDRWVTWAVLAYLLFFVYGSLVPLHWVPRSWDEAVSAFAALPGPSFGVSDRVDAAVNFLLPLPLAFGLAHLAGSLRVSGARVAAWLLIWPALALLSVAVEFTQLFFPPRNASWSDLAAQWAGAAAGLVLWAALGRRFEAWLAGFAAQQSPRARITRWLGLYLGAMLVFSVMPLDLSVSPVEIYRKWHAGKVILLPFGAPWPGAWEFAYQQATDILVWLPVGLLWRIDGRGRTLGAVVRRGLIAATLIELTQLFVMSRVTDVTEIVVAGVGLAIGAALPRPLRGWAALSPSRQREWLGRAWGVWLLVAMALLWLPFDFDLDRASIVAAREAFLRMPFETYFIRSEFGALNEILRKLLVFLPGGLLLSAWSARREPPQPALPLLGGMAGLAFVLEAGQLLLPEKVSDLTDALLGCLGAAAGWLIAASMRPGTWKLLAGPASDPAPPVAAERAAPRAVAPPPLGLQVALVAALAAVLWAASRMPGVPYNVIKLLPPGPSGALAAGGLALALWWIAAAPLLLLRPKRGLRMAFPLLCLAHAVATYAVLRLAVPEPMMHKIIGNPTLGWGGPWEDILRYSALHLSLLLPMFGAALLVRAVWQPASLADFVSWAFLVLMSAWPLHWAVVETASTDNLVELMRGGGSPIASLSLAGALFLAAAGASALAAALAQPVRRRSLLVLAGLALLLAPVLLLWGLEPMLVKYGRAFSALQFILSASREHYASGAELAGRFAVAYAALVGGITYLQWPLWRALAASASVAAPRRREHAAATPAA